MIIEALDYFQRHQVQRLDDEELTEDELSDLVNDRQFLEAIKQDLQKHHDELTGSREQINADKL